MADERADTQREEPEHGKVRAEPARDRAQLVVIAYETGLATSR